MPLIEKFNLHNGGEILISTMESAIHNFSSAENNSNLEKAFDARKQQFLAAKNLLSNHQGKEIQIIHSSSGKPSISYSNTEISISHSQTHIAIIVHRNDTGIDIEHIGRNTSRVASKFTSNEEISLVESAFETNPSLLIWTVKECLFKLIDCKGVLFQNHLSILDVKRIEDDIITTSKVSHPDYHGTVRVKSFIFENHLISYVDSVEPQC